MHIGDADPTLRDERIYPMFCHIIASDLLSPDQFMHLLHTCLGDNHLFYRIGESGTDAVFTRSFTALVLAQLVERDRERRLLSEVDFQRLVRLSTDYLHQEQDTRGFVERKGWAHSMAHGADLLAAICRHSLTLEENHATMLNAVAACLGKKATYIDDEEERLVFVIEALMNRGLPEDSVIVWIKQMECSLNALHDNEGFSRNYFYTKRTLTVFLQTLYFRLAYRDFALQTRQEITDVLKGFHKAIYEPN
ncbi:DUF2785 domain-containing protein [Paenalkalicoccus suaedae]|nr:DUF2785 domain-containing protein [Paenalkalicoccus suaedae]